MTRTDPVAVAREALNRAEEALAAAEGERDGARDRLDAALAERGWTRLVGAFTPDATPLYTSVLYPDAALRVDQVLTVLGQQARPAAA